MAMSNEFEGGVDFYRETLQAEWDRIAEDESRGALEDNIARGVIDDFIVHGYYGVSNWGGYEVHISDCGDMARLRDTETLEVSEWAYINYMPCGSGADEDAEMEMTIPLWGNVPLCMVMRVNR